MCAGYLYNRENVDGGKINWKCAEYHKLRCKGRCITVGPELAKVTGVHNHDPDLAKVARKVDEERLCELESKRAL